MSSFVFQMQDDTHMQDSDETHEQQIILQMSKKWKKVKGTVRYQVSKSS